jgi:hypothetical protein
LENISALQVQNLLSGGGFNNQLMLGHFGDAL